MFDYYFGSKLEISKNTEKYLLSIKRMFPKWMKSIPDSEFIALGRVARMVKNNKSVFVETGSGSSSLILLFHAIRTNGILFTWDINQSKTSQLRSIFNETIGRYFGVDINKHWVVINYFSTADHAGLSILEEKNKKIDLFFHDSEHVLDVILSELNLIKKLMKINSYICMDDANYNFKKVNTAYLNMVRQKINLEPIKLKNNTSEFFYLEVDKFLKDNFSKVNKIKDYYKNNYKKDIYFKYFNTEFNVKAKIKMENNKNLEHRFDAWKIS